MRVVVVGATGTIGKATVEAFEKQGDEVIAASRSSSPSIDMTDPASVDAFFDEVGEVDAVVATLGAAPFVSLPEASTEDFRSGFENKLLGQINLVLRGLPHLRDNGSFTLITGILTQHPVKKSVVATSVNGGVEAFVTGAATDLPRGIRINVVSPTVIEESLEGYGPSFPGFEPAPAARAGNAFVRSAHGAESGQVFRVW
ncbi:short chain dehydrogenase [Corynebacterium halotolerans]|uniref:short chain dehydrogenase n=1 Tax=Corynebacterium halotolerans TaxID=225326 RepID=UPI003CEE3DFC